MNKKAKTCLVLFLFSSASLAIALICTTTGFILGIASTEGEGISILEPQIATEKEIIEKTVYINQETSQRYIDEDSPSDIYQTLLDRSNDHFTFTFQVSDQGQYTNDKDFILVNLENQYARLSVKFDQDIKEKIQIKLTDDINQFEADLGFDYEDDPSFAGYARGSELIEIFLHPMITTDKFALATTLSHELIHIFQSQTNPFIFSETPLWYYEGMAESYAYPNEEVLIHETIYSNITTLDILNQRLDSPFADEYSVGYDGAELFYTHLTETYGDDAVISLANDVYPKTFAQHFQEVIGITPDQAYLAWLGSL